MTSGLVRLLAAVCICLVLNLSLCELCLAVEESHEKADSTRTVPGGTQPLKIERPMPPVSAKETPLISPDIPDSIPVKQPVRPTEAKAGQKTKTPIYKNGWFWAAGGSLLAITAIAIIAGGRQKAHHNLPGFPEPPGR